MGVAQNGDMEGSIGGGMMEHKFVELAKEKLKSSSSEISVRKQIHDKSAAKNQSGMICSGEQTILLYALQSKDINSLEEIISCLLHQENGKLNLSPFGIVFEKTGTRKRFLLSFRFRKQLVV